MHARRWAATSRVAGLLGPDDQRVLTLERVQGIRIDDAAIRKAGFDGTELVKALLFSVFEGRASGTACSTATCR